MSSNRGAAGKAIELTAARGNTALYDALFTSVGHWDWHRD